MTTPIDDLQVGRWFAIKAEREQQDDQPDFMDFSFFSRRSRPASAVNGQPLQILAMSLPFIVVTDGQRRFTLDSRQYEFIRLDRRYVEAITPAVVRNRNRESSGVVFLDEVKKAKKEEPDPRVCPHCCEGRLKQVHRQRDWLLVCPVCGFEGRPPNSNIAK